MTVLLKQTCVNLSVVIINTLSMSLAFTSAYFGSVDIDTIQPCDPFHSAPQMLNVSPHTNPLCNVCYNNLFLHLLTRTNTRLTVVLFGPQVIFVIASVSNALCIAIDYNAENQDSSLLKVIAVLHIYMFCLKNSDSKILFPSAYLHSHSKFEL